jgi:hypothetical protein
VLIAIILGGLVSCLSSSQANIWWNKYPDSNKEVLTLKIINDSYNPLVVSDAHPWSILSYIYQIKADRDLLLFKRFDSYSKSIDLGNASEVFLLKASDSLRHQFTSGYQVEPINADLSRVVIGR